MGWEMEQRCNGSGLGAGHRFHKFRSFLMLQFFYKHPLPPSLPPLTPPSGLPYKVLLGSHRLRFYCFKLLCSERVLVSLTMRSVLGFLGVLLAVFPAGQALSCIRCVTFGMTPCNGPSVSCPSDNVCGALYAIFTKSGSVVSKKYERDCVPKNQCNLQGSMSIINTHIHRIGVSCCNTDNCTPDLPTLPAVSTRFNGLVCRTCVSTYSGWCYTDDTMQCTGNENMCLLQTTSITGAVSMRIVLRGCATKSLCDLSRQTEQTADRKVDMRFTCTSGTAGLYSG
uniref:UPAR/Ly6 domain-containing protein n=1 Tax=Leptobrachium leishanense TaxID=445787 RepID=A0A8C5QXI8_9ANUR